MLRRSRRPAGLSLVEIIIGSVLLIAVGLVILALFEYAISGAEMGRLQALVQQDTRTALDNIKGQLGNSVPPPISAPGSLPVPSSVFFPTAYTDQLGPERIDPQANALILQKPQQKVGGNLLVFTMPNRDINQFVPADQTNYNIVIYYVSNDVGTVPFQQLPLRDDQQALRTPDQTNSQFVLYRKVVPLIQAGAVNPVISPGLNGNKWGPGNILGAINAGAGERVLTLTPGDRIDFEVRTSPATSPDATFGTNFDRNLYEIAVRVIRYQRVRIGLVGAGGAKRLTLNDSVFIRSVQQ